MNSEVKFVSGRKQAARLSATLSSTRRVDPERVREAFDGIKVGNVQGLDLYSVREAITRLLSPKGGRPSVEGSSAQVKIPRLDEDWNKIERIARAASGLPHKPSVTQTAALILHVALSSIPEHKLDEEMKKAFG
ncbi:hypothetical protein ABIB38_002277 [Massilia sp. UYP11]|uniref:hypothetical protein n=1 Tax=Massilia sp. UYP11 TaxID=1756385 RepID=UPI003D24758A